MNRNCRFSLFAMVLSIGGYGHASAGTFTDTDLPSIHQTYKANEARFNRDYVGQQFSARMSVSSIRENAFAHGTYHVGFGSSEHFTSDVDCSVSDPATVNKIIEWNKGDVITLSGIIKDHVMGSVILKSCNFN